MADQAGRPARKGGGRSNGELVRLLEAGVNVASSYFINGRTLGGESPQHFVYLWLVTTF